MSFPVWCLCIGAAAWVIAYLLKDVFVDDSDARNPFRLLVTALGYMGLVTGIYGALLLLTQRG